MCVRIKGTNDTERNEQRKLYFEASTNKKKKLHILNLTPSGLWQELYHIFINSDLSFIPRLLKTTSSPQCAQIFVSDD